MLVCGKIELCLGDGRCIVGLTTEIVAKMIFDAECQLRVVSRGHSSKGTGDSSTQLEVRGDTVSERIAAAEDIANFFMVLEGFNFRVRISQRRRCRWLRSLMRGSKDFSW